MGHVRCILSYVRSASSEQRAAPPPPPPLRKRKRESSSSSWKCTTTATPALTMEMESSSSLYKGYVLDPLKCSKLGMEEKHQLFYEIQKCSYVGAHEMLQLWSRQELLQILSGEMGKDRKYTGMAKMKIIERLLGISSKKPRERTDGPDLGPRPSYANNKTTSKRRRKSENPSRLPIENVEHAIYCQNPTCRATICPKDLFCKLCSCYICYQYDYSKDPSLWLFCSPKPPYKSNLCGMSCHLECALIQRKVILKDGHHRELDVSFSCVCCGEVNYLLRCLRNQLLTAKETKKVEILCYRLSLSQKLLRGTKNYQKIHELVDDTLRKVEAELGPLSGLRVNLAERNVTSLANGPEAQKLCAFAVESLDAILLCGILLPALNPNIQDSNLASTTPIRFENVSPTSVIVVLGFEDTSIVGWYKLWHRRVDVMDYPVEPTCTFFAPKMRFTLFNLTPAAVYIIKVVAFFNKKELETWEVRFMSSNDDGNNIRKSLVVGGQSPSTSNNILSNPSEEDESDNLYACKDKIDCPQEIHFGYGDGKHLLFSSNLFEAVSENISGSENRSTNTGQDETSGNSDSANGCVTEEVRSIPNLNLEPHKDSTRSREVNQSFDNVFQLKTNQSLQGQLGEDINTCTDMRNPVGDRPESVPFKYGVLPSSLYEMETWKDGLRKSCRSEPKNVTVDISWKREGPADANLLEKSYTKRDEEGSRSGATLEEEYVQCVNVIRSLECKRYLEKNFREKFLSWYSLRATIEEKKILKELVETLKGEPISLSGKLIETFSERIFSKRTPAVSSGVCLEIWH